MTMGMALESDIYKLIKTPAMAKLQFMVWGSGAPGLPGLRDPRWLVGDVQQKWDGLFCKRYKIHISDFCIDFQMS